MSLRQHQLNEKRFSPEALREFAARAVDEAMEDERLDEDRVPMPSMPGSPSPISSSTVHTATSACAGASWASPVSRHANAHTASNDMPSPSFITPERRPGSARPVRVPEQHLEFTAADIQQLIDDTMTLLSANDAELAGVCLAAEAVCCALSPSHAASPPVHDAWHMYTDFVLDLERQEHIDLECTAAART